MPADVVFGDRARDVQAAARRIADESVRPHAARCDRLQDLNREALRAAAGLLGLLVPAEHGGSAPPTSPPATSSSRRTPI